MASHGGAFHTPHEIQRILSHGLDKALQAQMAVNKVLVKHGITDEVPMPGLSTKEKAQRYIGLDMKKDRKVKEHFRKTTVPQWLEKAKSEGRMTTASL